jgi:uncharacterized membrane-anchored protein YjiN (DUF445 family)
MSLTTAIQPLVQSAVKKLFKPNTSRVLDLIVETVEEQLTTTSLIDSEVRSATRSVVRELLPTLIERTVEELQKKTSSTCSDSTASKMNRMVDEALKRRGQR